MKVRINYLPWRIVLLPPYDDPGATDINGSMFHQQMFESITKWRRFPAESGGRSTDKPGDEHNIYLLLDKIENPKSLMPPALSLITRAEPISAAELPKGLRELHKRLVLIGHASEHLAAQTEESNINEDSETNTPETDAQNDD